jgi:cysteine desulfurase / selenocysteine lyase
MPSTSGRALDDVRAAEFSALADAAYLNAASVGPLPERSRAAVVGHTERRVRVQDLEDADFAEPLRRCRAAAARLIGAGEDEIALGGNTSYGINLAALGLPLDRGTRVLLSDGEFPANVFPWMSLRDRGIEVEIVPTDDRGLPDEARMLDRLARGGVSVLALSSVQFGNGYLADLPRFAAACREQGAYFVVDAIQSLGAVPIDVAAIGIDVLACGGHKWLCGPFGTGFAYVRREMHERLQPPAVGWTSMESCRDFAHLTDYRWEWVRGARRYEVATPPFQDMLGLACSLELLDEVGVDRIERHVRALLDRLIDWLSAREAVEIVSDLDDRRRSGIVAFRVPRPEQTVAALHRAGVGCVVREGAIRVAPHLYNTSQHVDRMIDVLTEQEWS